MPNDIYGLLSPQSDNSFYGFSPLTNFGLGLLASSGPSLTPQSPWQAIGRAGQLASQSQAEALKNQYMREQIRSSRAKSATEAWAISQIFGGGAPGAPADASAPAPSPSPAPAATGGDTGIAGANAGASADASAAPDITPAPIFNPGSATVNPSKFSSIIGNNNPALAAAAFILNPGATATKLLQAPMTEEQRVNTLNAWNKYSDAQKQDLIEGATANASITTANDAETLLERMNNGPLKPGSQAAKWLWNQSHDKDGNWVSLGVQDFSDAISRFGGKKYSPDQLQQIQDDWDRFGKLSAKAVITEKALQQAWNQAGGGQGGRTSNFNLGFIQASNINPTVSLNANRAILRDQVRSTVTNAKVKGWKLSEQGTADRLLKNWDTSLNTVVDYSQPAPAGTAPATTIPEAAADVGGYVKKGIVDWANRVTGQTSATPPPSIGVQNGQIVPQPAPVYSPLPSPGAANAAPAPNAPSPDATRVQTIPISPNVKLDAQGVPTFNRFADLQRAERNGWLSGFKSVMVNGKIYDWVQ